MLLGLEPAENPMVRVKGSEGFVDSLETAHLSGDFTAYIHTSKAGAPMHRAHLLEHMTGGKSVLVTFIDIGSGSAKQVDYEVDLAGFAGQWSGCIARLPAK